jgi:hypothetical protein
MHCYLSVVMSRIHSFLSYGASVLLLLTAVFFSARYMWTVYQSAKNVHRTETIYLTRGDTTANFYKAYIPAAVVKGMLVLDHARLTRDGFRMACENGLLVISASPAVTLEHPYGQPGAPIDRIIADAARRYDISSDKIIIGHFVSHNSTRMQFVKADTTNNPQTELTMMFKEVLPGSSKDGYYPSVVGENELIAWSVHTLKESN